MGPLKGVKIVEMGGIGPGPFCAMLLSDMGADIIRIDRKGTAFRAPERGGPRFEVMHRGRRSVAVDLKKPEGVEAVLKLIDRADALIEGFRPGVMERLGLGPDVAHKRNQKLVYGRMTGWGQEGPLAQAAGHDINYIALTGALHATGQKNGRPTMAMNLIGDFGGGALFLAVGVLCGIIEARQSGKGQVVDAAMSDGASLLMAMMYGMHGSGYWKDERGVNLLDGGSHFYDAYETKDGKWISLGSIEPQFYALLREKAGLTDPAFDAQMDRARWPELKQKVAAAIKTKTRDEWCKLMEGTDVCFAPVLSLAEAPRHPHNVARKTFVEVEGVLQPAPSPRFSRTAATIQGAPPVPGEHSESALADWGVPKSEIEKLKAAGAL